MKLSKRLEEIATFIPQDSSIIDIGCDHALLDIYLSLEKNCSCIASDINPNALDQANYNIKRYHAKNIKTVLADGLEGIPIHPQDILVISGMGTLTIEHILNQKTLENRLIVSTHTEQAELRKFMVLKGYRIQDEHFVEEKGKQYIIIDFVKGESTYEEEDYVFGPILKHCPDFLQREYEKTKELLELIPTTDREYAYQEEILKELDRLIANI